MEWKSPLGCNAFVRHRKTLQSNHIILSGVTCISGDVTDSPYYALNYVIKGTEKYYFNKKMHKVDEGKYLLLNKGQNYGCEMNGNTLIQGLCIKLEAELLSSVYDRATRSENDLLDNPFEFKNLLPEFHETIYYASGGLDKELKKIIKSFFEIEAGAELDAYKMYHDLAFEIIASQRATQLQIRSIKATNKITRNEVYNRLNIAKTIIDSNGLEKMLVADIARQASLSEFHFYRCFKDAFGISPHKYIMQTRLKRSFDLLKQSANSISDVALICGYSDIHTFSKAFKKQFRVSPSAIKTNRSYSIYRTNLPALYHSSSEL